MNTLDGYFGGGGHRRHNKTHSNGSSLGSTGYQVMTATPKSAFRQKPPGFAGYAGKRGGGDFF
jgi:hypothetical protein